MVCQTWALQGYGAPPAVYTFYILKTGFYLWMWLWFCSFSKDLGTFGNIGTWWFKPEALLKAIAWSMLFEGAALFDSAQMVGTKALAIVGPGGAAVNEGG